MCFLSLEEVNRNQVDVPHHKEKAKKIDWKGFNYPVTRTEDTQNAICAKCRNFCALLYFCSHCRKDSALQCENIRHSHQLSTLLP